MATITLPNGTIISATEEMISRLLKGTEDGVHYNSSTHGKIKIADMATPHIKNAVAKSVREAIDSLRTKSAREFAREVKRGLGADDITLTALIEELKTRRD